MDCPECGIAQADSELVCTGCDALLNPSSAEPRDSAPPALTSEFAYTGDLPRLFRFGSRYQVLEKVGEGGMGRVYKALDLELDRPVALKTIRSEHGVGPDVLRRFKQELILARKVTHKNVVRIHDLGESDGIKFFTMELVDGGTLRELVSDKGRLSVGDALSLFTQLLAGLGEAHRQGVVHRDLKPQNLLVDTKGTLRITDFGIARAVDSNTLTGTSEIIGTPDYISPEQVRGDTADNRSDLYAAGVILFELVTGETPFKGETPLARVLARIQNAPPAPRSIRPDLPPLVEQVVLKLLESDPELRYQSAESVLDDLEREHVDRRLALRVRKFLGKYRLRLAWAMLCALAAIALTAYVRLPSPGAIADGTTTSLAVLPFHNQTRSTELDWMENALPELLVTDLSQSPSLRPLRSGRVSQILRDLGKQGQTQFDPETVRVVAELSKVDYALHGSLVGTPTGVRVELTLRESATGVAHRFGLEGEASEVFALVDSMTERIAEQLDVETSKSDRPLAEVSTTSVEAYRAFHDGKLELLHGSKQAAIPLFRRAVALDENFAMAHAHLAKALLDAGDEADARTSAATALHLLESMPLSQAERYQIHAMAAQANDDPSTAVDSYEALSHLFPDDPEVVLSLADAQELAGDIPAAAETYRRALELAPEYGAAVLGVGRALVTSGRHEDAIDFLQTQTLSGEHIDLETESMLLSILGVAHRNIGHSEAAEDALAESLALRREIGDERGIATSLTNLAVTHGLSGRFDDARDELTEALAIARRQKNVTIESFALVNLGWLEEIAGRPRTAVEMYRESLSIEWERGQRYEIADRLNLIGNMYRHLGRYADATVFLEHARSLTEDSQLTDRANNAFYQGRVAGIQGFHDDAARAFLTSSPLYLEAGERDGAARAQLELARLYTRSEHFEPAAEAVRRSIELSTGSPSPEILAAVELERARLLLRQTETEQARAVLEAIETFGIEERVPPLLPALLRARAELFLAEGDAPRAIATLERALVVATSLEDAGARVELLAELAALSARRGQVDTAHSLATTCVIESTHLRLRTPRASATLTLARIEADAGRLERAGALVDEADELTRGFDIPEIRRRSRRVRAAIAAHTAEE